MSPDDAPQFEEVRRQEFRAQSAARHGDIIDVPVPPASSIPIEVGTPESR